jgi:hypothetical protein
VARNFGGQRPSGRIFSVIAVVGTARMALSTLGFEEVTVANGISNLFSEGRIFPEHKIS